MKSNVKSGVFWSMKNADTQTIRKEDNTPHAYQAKIKALQNDLQMEKEMRENLEHAIDEITEHLFSSLEELTTHAEQLRKRNLELEIQDKIVKIINQEISLRSVLKTLLHQAVSLLSNGDKGAFLQYDPLSNQFRFAAVEGYDGTLMEKGNLSYEEVMALTTQNVKNLDEGIFVIQNFDLDAARLKTASETNPKSMYSIALSFDKKLEEFLILDNKKNFQNFDQSEIQNLLRFREHAITAISKAKILELLQAEKEKTEKALKITQEANKELESARKKMEEMSLTDTLTKLRNRRYLATFIDREISHSLRKYDEWRKESRSNKPRNADIAFFMLDIDYFKWVNDTFGHESGDRVLEQMGQLLKKNCRDSDIVIRWGGEEFLIVSLNTNQSQAQILAERIRTSIENHTFKIENDQKIHRTCSIGFACYPFMMKDIRALDYEQIISIADKCLYISKMSGRNASVSIQSNESIAKKDLLKRINSNLDTMFNNKEIQIFTSVPEIKNLSIFK